MQVPDPNPLAHLWWWFEIHLGITPKAPPSYYDAWSGSFSDIGEVTLLGAVGDDRFSADCCRLRQCRLAHGSSRQCGDWRSRNRPGTKHIFLENATTAA